MNIRWTVVAMAVAVALCALSGVVQGVATHRWGKSQSVVNASEQVAKLPSKFGEWELQSEQKLSPEVEAILESPAYKSGTFVNRQTGEVVGFAFLAGEPGPISVHTPDICYSSAHYEISDRRATSIDGPNEADVFWQLDLQSRSVDASPLRVYYAWSAGDDWQASENPRLSFLNTSVLYKIQIAFDPSGTPKDSDDVGRRFLTDYLQAIAPIIGRSK